MDLAISYITCESSSKSWGEFALYGLEGASSCCWPCKGRGSERSSESAVSEAQRSANAIEDRGIQQTEFPYLLNIMSDVEEREGSEWKNAMRVFELGMILRRIEVYG